MILVGELMDVTASGCAAHLGGISQRYQRHQFITIRNLDHGLGPCMIEQSGTKRLGTADDIAAVVEFVISPAASFITGTDLLVDGGVVAALRYGNT